MLGQRDILKGTADLIMSLLAEAGGEGPDYFKSSFSNGLEMSDFRPIRYPKRIDNIPKGAYLEDGRS